MTPRRRAILIVTLALLLIGVVIAIILVIRRAVTTSAPVTEPTAQEPATTPEPEVPAEEVQNPLVTQPVVLAGRTAAAQMAELFAERYGSYSNQGDYQNLIDLLPVMTVTYRRSTEAYLASVETQHAQTFEGVTSVKVSTDTRTYDERAGTAVVAVTLQQSQAKGAAAPTVVYRTLRMELQKDGDDWRVDNARWEN